MNFKLLRLQLRYVIRFPDIHLPQNFCYRGEKPIKPALLGFKKKILQLENWWKSLANEDALHGSCYFLRGSMLWDIGSSFSGGWSQEIYLVNKTSSFRHVAWCGGGWEWVFSYSCCIYFSKHLYLLEES